MPTAMKVKEEKNTNTTNVRFETSTSPSWNDIKMFIYFFLNINTIAKKILQHLINTKELQSQK